jgi:hypothetical protein
MENKQELSIDNESHAFNQKRIKATIGNIQILWYIFGMKQAEIISMKMLSTLHINTTSCNFYIEHFAYTE